VLLGEHAAQGVRGVVHHDIGAQVKIESNA